MTPLSRETRSAYRPAQLTTCSAGELAGGRFDDRLPGVAANRGDAGAGDDLAAALADDRGEPPRDLRVVDDARLGHVDRGNPGTVRLDLAQPLGADPFAAHAVGRAVGERLLELRKLLLLDRDNHLAAHFPRNALARAELFHRRFARAAVLRPQRTGAIVDAGMEHARVAARLMLGDDVFLFEDDDRLAGKAFEKAVARRQSDDAAADND